MSFYVYILASRRNGTLYVGMTDDLVRRIWLHREGALPGFTKQHKVTRLVWYEHTRREHPLLSEKTDEEMESILEIARNRDLEPGLARSLR